MKLTPEPYRSLDPQMSPARYHWATAEPMHAREKNTHREKERLRRGSTNRTERQIEKQINKMEAQLQYPSTTKPHKNEQQSHITNQHRVHVMYFLPHHALREG